MSKSSKPAKPASTYSRIYKTIKRIPRGRVATYGQIATLANMAGNARQVGYALAATPDSINIPWHRVVNAKGEISKRSESAGEDESQQRKLLEAEGVEFNQHGRISLKKYQWQPRGSL